MFVIIFILEIRKIKQHFFRMLVLTNKPYKESLIITKNRFDFINSVSWIRTFIVFHPACLNHTWRPKSAC